MALPTLVFLHQQMQADHEQGGYHQHDYLHGRHHNGAYLIGLKIDDRRIAAVVYPGQ